LPSAARHWAEVIRADPALLHLGGPLARLSRQASGGKLFHAPLGFHWHVFGDRARRMGASPPLCRVNQE